jgi:branched-chain amino acid transport system substrate-binding protein
MRLTARFFYPMSFCFFLNFIGIYPSFSEPQVNIGVAVGLTGVAAALGEEVVAGVREAATEINARGGLLGQPINLHVADDGLDPRQGVSVAHKMISEGVSFLIGHFTSSVSTATAGIYAEGGVLQISPGATNPIYTDQKLWNTFRVVGRDDQQGESAALYIAKHFAQANIALIHDKTPYGKGLVDETARFLHAKGIQPIVYEAINPGEKDYTALVSKLKAAHITLVYYGGTYFESALILKQMRDYGIKGVFMAGDALAAPDFPMLAGPAGEGALMTFAPDPRKHDSAKHMISLFEEKNLSIGPFTVYGYAAMEVLEQAVKETRSLDSRTLATFLRSGHIFNTALGPLAFDEKGDIKGHSFLLYQWGKDKMGRLSYALASGE